MSKVTALNDDAKWRAESDLRSLKEAHEVAQDPKRKKAAHQVAADQMAALRKITGKVAAEPKKAQKAARKPGKTDHDKWLGDE